MTREWKPGDVAVISGGNYRALRTDERWVFHDNSSTSTFGEDAAGFRPLVVIDPEDRERVALLRDALDPDQHLAVATVAAALREFANPTPPKPDEPTGLGAVVEDDARRRWVRTYLRYGTGWVNGDVESGWEPYSAINAVKVLSEGVTP